MASGNELQARCPACGWWGTITADHRVTTWTCPICGRFYAVAEPASDEIRMMLVTETPQAWQFTREEYERQANVYASWAETMPEVTYGTATISEWRETAAMLREAAKHAPSSQPAETPQAWQFTREEYEQAAEVVVFTLRNPSALPKMLREAAKHAPSSQAGRITSPGPQERTERMSEHVCGLQGFGAIGDTCPACDERMSEHCKTCGHTFNAHGGSGICYAYGCHCQNYVAPSPAAASGVPAGKSITLPVASMRELDGQLQEMKHMMLSIASLIPPDISGKQPGDIFRPDELVKMVRKLVESRNG